MAIEWLLNGYCTPLLTSAFRCLRREESAAPPVKRASAILTRMSHVGLDPRKTVVGGWLLEDILVGSQILEQRVEGR